jgi:hypothetical protein
MLKIKKCLAHKRIFLYTRKMQEMNRGFFEVYLPLFYLNKLIYRKTAEFDQLSKTTNIYYNLKHKKSILIGQNYIKLTNFLKNYPKIQKTHFLLTFPFFTRFLSDFEEFSLKMSLPTQFWRVLSANDCNSG